jgi:hypothetical protein
LVLFSCFAAFNLSFNQMKIHAGGQSGSPQGEFWASLASYASELAQVSGPLLEAIAQTASAIDRAQRGSSTIEVSRPARLKSTRAS